MTVFAIYSRKSRFSDIGDSINNQINLCMEYIKSNYNSESIVVYEDEGYSGGNSDRPMFQKLLKDARNRKFNVLVCYRLDRISRNIADFAGTMEILNSNEISFVSIKEHFDTATPMGRAMMYITSVFAQLERETIAERIKDNMHQLARTGRWLGGKSPFGYISKAVYYYDDAMNKKKLYNLSSIENELSIVKLLYKKYLEIGTLSGLEAWSLKNNISLRNNSSPDRSTLKVILTNPVYVKAEPQIFEYFKNLDADLASPIKEFDSKHGLMVFNKHKENKGKSIRRKENHWIVAVGNHLGVVQAKDWISVQNIIKSKKNKSPRDGTGIVGLATGLIYCKSCGSRMRIIVCKRKNKVYHYYKCILKEQSNGRSCNIKNLNGKLADNLILDELKSLDFDVSYLVSSIEDKKSTMLLVDNVIQKDKKKLEQEIKEYEQKINTLIQQLSIFHDLPTSEYIVKEIEDLHTRIEKSKSILRNTYLNESLNNADSKSNQIVDRILAGIDEKSFDDLSKREQKIIVDILIQRIYWDGKNLELFMVSK